MDQKEKNYITPDGFKNLTDEFDYLSKKERPETVKIVSWAAALGDRSENADYIYGKKRLREIDRRLRFLAKRIEIALIVNPESINTDKVQFGATVDVIDEEERLFTYSIVGSDETDSKRGYISWKSPIGSALIGKKVGDEIEVKAPKGSINLEIKSITYKKLEQGGYGVS